MTADRPGIRRFGAYLPRLRLERKAIAAATAFATGSRAGAAKGTRSCCNWDEDSLTMAVEAARDCLAGIAAPAIDSLTFASTSHAFADRSNAGVVATALNLDESLRVADAGGHQRSGVGALITALTQAATSSSLVVAADRRLAKPASEQESSFGHGAAALLVGTGADVAAELLASASLQDDFVDHYRSSDARFDYALEERWVRDEGYVKIVPRAIAAALAQAGIAAAAIDRFILQGPARFATVVAKAAGIKPEAILGDLHAQCGNTGVAHPLLQLGAALETASAGEIILVASFGQGSDALVLRATGRSPSLGRGAAGAFAEGVSDGDYVRFLANCGLVEIDWGMRAERDNRTAQSTAWRKHSDVTGFVGGRCTQCAHGAVSPFARLRES